MAHSDVRIVAFNGQETFAQSGATDAARGTILLNAVGQLAAGDHLILGPGGFDVGTSLIEPAANGVIISGAGWQTIVRGQPPNAPPVVDAVFRPVGNDIELRDIAIHATGGSGIAFGSTQGKPRGDRFIARGGVYRGSDQRFTPWSVTIVRASLDGGTANFYRRPTLPAAQLFSEDRTERIFLPVGFTARRRAPSQPA